VLRALVESLHSAGCAITREPEKFPGFGLIAFGQDPDGYDIEMIQREG
jgi:predicted enzyme related to lactoylglutathione lyase